MPFLLKVEKKGEDPYPLSFLKEEAAFFAFARKVVRCLQTIVFAGERGLYAETNRNL